MFSAVEQTAMMADMATHTAVVDGTAAIEVKFRRKPAVAQFTDGSVETYQPYCIVTADDAETNEIVHGTVFEIDDEDWSVIGISQQDSGFYKVEVSKS